MILLVESNNRGSNPTAYTFGAVRELAGSAACPFSLCLYISEMLNVHGGHIFVSWPFLLQ
jgi:hypothetical protein